MTFPQLAPSQACLALLAGLLAFAPPSEADVLVPVLAPSTTDSTVGIDVAITCDTPGAEIRDTPNADDPILHGRQVANGVSISDSRNAVVNFWCYWQFNSTLSHLI